MLVEELGSFCNLVCAGEGRDVFADDPGETQLKEGIGLQGFELLEASMEGALDADVVAGEAVEFMLVRAGAQFGFHAADAAEVPGGRDQLIEQGLLDWALRFDLRQEIGKEFLELVLLAGRDHYFAGGESMLAGVLGGAGFSIVGPGSSGMPGIGSVVGELGW